MYLVDGAEVSAPVFRSARVGLTLLAEGRSPEDIRQLTGSPLKAIVARLR